jgi:DNA-binding NarL/FixJ family response regulator
MVEAFEEDALLQQSIPHELPRRQREVLLVLIQGWSEKHLAAQLNLSVHTVHVHIKCIYEHYGVHSRAELLAKCILRLLKAHHLLMQQEDYEPLTPFAQAACF